MSVEVQADNPDSLVLSVTEAGRLLGCSRNHAYRMARRGVIPTIALGSKLIVPKGRFLAWLNGPAPTAAVG